MIIHIDTFLENTPFDTKGNVAVWSGPYLPSHAEVDKAIAALLWYKQHFTQDQIDIFSEEKDLEQYATSQELPRTKEARKVQGYIYVLKTQGLCKIGRSKAPKNRLKKYRTENASEVEIIILAFVPDMRLESDLLKLFLPKHHHGEWYDLANKDLSIAEKMIIKAGGLLIK